VQRSPKKQRMRGGKPEEGSIYAPPQLKEPHMSKGPKPLIKLPLKKLSMKIPLCGDTKPITSRDTT
jgi:hypothetical protein